MQGRLRMDDDVGVSTSQQSYARTAAMINRVRQEVDTSRGPEDPLSLMLEIKGLRQEDARAKKDAMETCWIPGVNNNGQYGRWALAEFTDASTMQSDFNRLIQQSQA